MFFGILLTAVLWSVCAGQQKSVYDLSDSVVAATRTGTAWTMSCLMGRPLPPALVVRNHVHARPVHLHWTVFAAHIT